MKNLVELKKDELLEVEGGNFWFRALRVAIVAAAAGYEAYQEYQNQTTVGEPSDWASSACEGCMA